MKPMLSPTRPRRSAPVRDLGEVEYSVIRPDELSSVVDMEHVNLSLLYMRSKFLVIARIDREFVGVCGIRGMMNTISAEIREKFQGQGIGNELMTRVIDIARKRGEKFILGAAYLTNYRSLKLTEKFGFINLFVFTGSEVNEMFEILPLSRAGWFSAILLSPLRKANPRALGLLYSLIQRLVSRT